MLKTHHSVTTASVICPSCQALRKVTAVTWHQSGAVRVLGLVTLQVASRLFMIICHLNVSWTSLLVLTLVILFAMSSGAGDNYVSVDFEVFGNVQGAYLKLGDISSRHASKNRRAFIYITAPKSFYTIVHSYVLT